jgi:uncharacterized protein
MTLNDKLSNLKHDLKRMGRIVLAFSGGVDSTLLLKVASLSGPDKVIAVTASSESLPMQELAFAREMVSNLGIEHRIIKTEELRDNHYADNPPDRCYYCKRELFTKLREIALRENVTFIIDGTNADDARDWRPGRRAAEEAGVHSPLLTAGLCKEEIREISRRLGLPTWNKPATPCLSSRFPYGQRITAPALERVDRAERFIKQFGFKDLRVRVHSDTARIEIDPEDFPVLTDESVRRKIVVFLKDLGYKYITLDLQGFRSGSLNESLHKSGKATPKDSHPASQGKTKVVRLPLPISPEKL